MRDPARLRDQDRACYAFLAGVAAQGRGDLGGARAHLTAADTGRLRTDNMRSIVQCHLAEVALANGDSDGAREHLEAARRLSHAPAVDRVIGDLEGRLPAAGQGVEGTMLKFVVVLYRRPDLSPEQFHENLRNEHGPLAERLPGLRRYIQNHVAPDPDRPPPGWDAVVELFWDDRAAMEAAWKTPEGRRATDHLAEFVDLSRSRWSVVSEEVRR